MSLRKGTAMPQIFTREQIEGALEGLDVVSAVEEGFVAYSEGKVVVPPVGELVFDDPPGDVHIKYGYIRGDEYFVIKVASGFYDNVKLGLPPADGLMLVFSQKTAQLECILLDECHLTNVRTAAAGAVVARYLAPSNVDRIGVFGAGVQGRMQIEALLPIISCRDLIVWGVDQGELDGYRAAMAGHGFTIETTLDGDEIAASCNLIVTATPSRTPLLRDDQIREGTHITAMGSDTADKVELEPAILGRAPRRGQGDRAGKRHRRPVTAADLGSPDHRCRSDRGRRSGHPDLDGGVRGTAGRGVSPGPLLDSVVRAAHAQ
jgi:ornithine cyclodeaminase